MLKTLTHHLSTQAGGFLANWCSYGLSNAWFSAPFYFFRQFVRAEVLEKSNPKPESSYSKKIENMGNDFLVMILANEIMDKFTEMAIEQSMAINPYIMGALRTACIGMLYKMVNNQTIDANGVGTDLLNGFNRAFLITQSIKALQSILFYSENEVTQTVLAAGGVMGESLLHLFKNMPTTEQIVQPMIRATNKLKL